MPYSTHDLALSVALNFFKRPEQIDHLKVTQLGARLLAIQWTTEKKGCSDIASEFRADALQAIQVIS